MIEIAIVLIAIFTAQVTPGPNMMAVVATSLGSGRKAGVSTAIGVSIGVFLWAVTFTTSGGAFFEAFPQSVTMMKLVGGGYLLYLASSAIWRAVTISADNGGEAQKETSSSRAFLKGFFVVSTNPKAALVWMAVSAYLAPLSLSFIQYVLFGVSVAVSALIVFGGYAFLFSTPAIARRYQRIFRYADSAFGASFGAIGGKLVWDGVRDMRV